MKGSVFFLVTCPWNKFEEKAQCEKVFLFTSWYFFKESSTSLNLKILSQDIDLRMEPLIKGDDGLVNFTAGKQMLFEVL